MNVHQQKVFNLVLCALQDRGYTPGEAKLLLEKITLPVPSNGGSAPRGGKVNPSYMMPFGKHKGSHINELPSDYIIWLSSQDWVNSKFTALAQALRDEINQRNTRGRI